MRDPVRCYSPFKGDFKGSNVQAIKNAEIKILTNAELVNIL